MVKLITGAHLDPNSMRIYTVTHLPVSQRPAHRPCIIHTPTLVTYRHGRDIVRDLHTSIFVIWNIGIVQKGNGVVRCDDIQKYNMKNVQKCLLVVNVDIRCAIPRGVASAGLKYFMKSGRAPSAEWDYYFVTGCIFPVASVNKTKRFMQSLTSQHRVFPVHCQCTSPSISLGPFGFT